MTKPTTRTREPGVVNNVVYVGGERLAAPDTLEDTFRLLGQRADALAWIGLYRPDTSLLLELAEQFGLHELAVEDAVLAHQRPKVERYGDTLFLALKAVRYDDEHERVEFGELHVFAGPNFVITVRHADSPDLSVVRRHMESTPAELGAGAEAVLYAILDAVVDGFAPVIEGLANDLDEIETQVFGGDPAVSRRIYQLSREVIEFERAVKPLREVVAAFAGGLADGQVEEHLRPMLRDIADHVTQTAERVDEFRSLLRDVLAVNTTLIGQRRTEEMQTLSEINNKQAEDSRKISGWAAILFAPTLIGSVYGMNFDDMPELSQPWGYPAALALMLASSVVLYAVFKRKGWL